MGSATIETPVVIVGLNPTGLGLVRALAPHCARLVALESNRQDPATRTRLCHVHWVRDLADHDALLDEVRGLAARLGDRPVLFLSTDEHVLWAARARDRLEPHVRLLLPPAPVCEELMLKDRFLALAAREGWPVPPGAFLPVAELAGAIERAGLRYPVILKPTIKSVAWDRRQLSKAYIVRAPEEARAVGERVAGVVDHLLAQEYLEGDDGQVFFCLYLAAPGLEAPLTFCGRKLLQWPPLRGSTAACEPADAPELEALTRTMFDRLGVEGFASLEVKYAREGGFRIIEPTIGRVDLQSPVATLNGMNMPLVATLAALGRAAEAAPFATRVRSDVAWLYESSLWSLLRTGALDRPALLALARRPKGFALSSWADPFVIGAYARARLASAARRARARVAG